MVTDYSKLKVNERSIEYRYLEGNSNCPTIVLLHEGLGSVAQWRDFPDLLAAATGCSVFLYSRFGYGGSDAEPLPWPLDYMQREGLYGLPAVLDAAKIGPCVLFGHSDGASIALVSAGGVRDPRVKAVVLLAPHVFAEERGLASIRNLREAYRDGELAEKLTKYHGKNRDCVFYGWCDSWLHDDFRHWTIESFLTGITVPILQIQGTDDQYGTSLQLRTVAAKVPATVNTYLLADCRHSPHFNQSDYTIHLIKRFVANCAKESWP